ncbi:hypothetical protein D3C86_1486450 [compost metagenome]
MRQLLGVEPAIIVFGQALAVKRVQVMAQAGFLLRIAGGAIQGSALAVIAVDAFTIEDNRHLIRNTVQQIDRSPALLGRQVGEQAILAQQVPHQPAAIAPRGAKTGGLRFNDGDVQPGCQALEVIRGPEVGVPRANDRHVDIQIPFQRRTRQQGLVELIHPQTDSAPRRHARLRHSNFDGVDPSAWT